MLVFASFQLHYLNINTLLKTKFICLHKIATRFHVAVIATIFDHKRWHIFIKESCST